MVSCVEEGASRSGLISPKKLPGAIEHAPVKETCDWRTVNSDRVKPKRSEPLMTDVFRQRPARMHNTDPGAESKHTSHFRASWRS